MKIAIGIPNTGHFNDHFVNSYGDMLLSMSGEVFLWVKKSALVYRARNELMDNAKMANVDYLLMIDSDMIFPQNAIQKMIELNKDIVTGIYYQKAYPFRPNIYSWTGKDYFVHKNIINIPKDPFKIDSCGAGFLLISKKVIQNIGKNSFSHIVSGGDLIGEDTSFCWRCKDKYEIWAMNVGLGHSVVAGVTSTDFENAKNIIRTIDQKNAGIPGWTTEKELEWLCMTATDMESIAEVGSWKGRSTHVLLQGCRGDVYAIDHFEGSESDETSIKASDEKVYEQFMKNVGAYPNLKVLKMSSEEGAKQIDKVDMVFIDADHTYESVKKDIETWLPKTKKLICGHDYSKGWPDVVRAVNDALGEVKVIDTIWYKEVA